MSPFAAYRATGGYDEFCTTDGQMRPAWKKIAETLDRLGVDEIEQCAREASRLVRESGANFHEMRGEQLRPWNLAIVPLVIDAESWAKLESGLQQRLQVLEAVLADLFGEKRLLKERVLPAEILSANPYFERVYPTLPVDGNHLSLTATDLARDSDGTWWVTGDRTRAPSGLGYALENRVITSRVFPKMIRRNNVVRVASFFSSVQEHFHSLAPRHRENPRVAILTPGKASYRYIEDAYLARYLGFTLVQGRDLAVRGNHLNLKTLGGLLPIEVLWRHISDQKCDPLELDPASAQGTTGLCNAVRNGTVAVANCIGATIAQTPALMPFLNNAAKFLTGEELRLPSVPTYWCGGQKERDYVLQHLDDLMIRPAFMVSGDPPIIPSELSSNEKDELIAKIKARPFHYIAQHRPHHSTTPVWDEGRLKSWYVTLRSFQVLTQDGANVLPGGLVRVSPDSYKLDQSPTAGRLGQDCWVIGNEPVDHDNSLIPAADAPIKLIRAGDDLPSRVAENLFWLGRYSERSESVARLLRTTMICMAGESDLAELPQIPKLITALAAVGQLEPDYAIETLHESMPDLEEALPRIVFDMESPGALQSGLMAMLQKATEVRDRLSLDAYRIISRLCDNLTAADFSSERNFASAIEHLDRLITDLLAFSGLSTESVTRTHGWRFLRLGRRIERAYQTAEVLSATLVTPDTRQSPILEAVLDATDSLMTYRSRYLLKLRSMPVLDLLITDETNPRSIIYQAVRIARLLKELPTAGPELAIGQDERLAAELLHRARMSRPEELAKEEDGHRVFLQSFLANVMDDLPRLSDAIAARYLIHTGLTQQLTGRVSKT
ncbi:MAG: circularly permuted type 2 ATP-grasp protein [Planctomycetota bacterium]